MLIRRPMHVFRRAILTSVAILTVTVAVQHRAARAEGPKAQRSDDRAIGAALADDLVALLNALGEEGPTLRPLLPRSTILSVSGRLRPEAVSIVLRRLSDPDFLARVRTARPEIAGVLAGLAEAAPLTREIEPEVQLVFARQSFAGAGEAVPIGKFPGVALVFVPRDEKRARQLFLSAYWAAMAQANEQAKASGRPRLKMRSERRGDSFFAGATFVPPEGEEFRGLADYNLSPAIGIVGHRFIFSSSKELASELVNLAAIEDEIELERLRGSLRVDVGPVAAAEIACDNLPAIAERLFGVEGHAHRAVERLSRATNFGLASLPHVTWQLPSVRLVPWRTRSVETAVAEP